MNPRGNELAIYKTDAGYGALGRHARDFIIALQHQSYSTRTIYGVRRCLSKLGQHLLTNNIAVSTLDVVLLLEQVRNLGSNDCRRYLNRAMAQKLFVFLVQHTAIAPPRLTPRDRAKTAIKSQYTTYLRDQRGLVESTINKFWSVANQFIDHACPNEDFSFQKITSKYIIDYLLSINNGKPLNFYHKSAPSNLKPFLRFLFHTGATKSDLSTAIPRMRKRYESISPHYLEPHQVDELISVAKECSSKKTSLRNYAMLLVLARLALRAQEAAAIRLDDIDWLAGELLVRGKGNLLQKMPLPQDVGDAFVDYIKNERPTSSSRHLFVRTAPPFPAFSGGTSFNTVLKQNLERAGIKMPERHIGAHVFRHSLATRMVRNGASLDEVRDFLRHATRATTMLYAKLDHGALRPVAQPWPRKGADK